MTQLEVRLLGRPTVLLDGVEVEPPKGAKPWGLLAYLASSRRSHARPELAELLFSAAADPLGALRWNLAALRRLLVQPDALKGDAISLDLADVVIDTWCLEQGELGAPAGDLLAGLSFGDSPVFELWLAGERSRLRRRMASVLREAALRALACGDHSAAIDRAGQLVALDPLDEGHHALLIRAHAVAGDPGGARRQLEQCRHLLQVELGMEPGPAVLAAADLAAGTADGTAPVDRDVIGARMTVAWQSFLGGAVDHAIDLGRTVVAMSDRDGDRGLRITARLFLVGMLSIAVRGWDESATLTTDALHLAEQADRADDTALAHGIRAGIELMRADYGAATRHAEAGVACSSEPSGLALNLTFLAAAEADVGRLTEATEHAVAAVGVAEATADPIRLLYAYAYAGQAHLLADQVDSARGYLVSAVEASSSMLVLRPWPTAMLAEVDARSGDLDRAARHAKHALALATTTDVAYQRALALRATALVDLQRGDHDAAAARLTAALFQARRTTGEGYSFHWPVAWILDTLATASSSPDLAATHRWGTALLEHATATGMGTFVRRAEGHLAAR